MAEILSKTYDADSETTVTRAVEDGKTHTVYVANVPQMLLELNRHERDTDPKGVRKGFSMRRLARVPIALHIDLVRKGIWGDKQRMKAWLNDPDNRFFRSSGGRV